MLVSYRFGAAIVRLAATPDDDEDDAVDDDVVDDDEDGGILLGAAIVILLGGFRPDVGARNRDGILDVLLVVAVAAGLVADNCNRDGAGIDGDVAGDDNGDASRLLVADSDVRDTAPPLPLLTPSLSSPVGVGVRTNVRDDCDRPAAARLVLSVTMAPATFFTLVVAGA